MKDMLFGVLGLVLLVTSCATPTAGSSSQPNTASAMMDSKQAKPKDPHDHLIDPAVHNRPPEADKQPPLCGLQCGPGMRCDASGLTERCVPDEAQRR